MPTDKDSVLVSILILSIPSRIEKYLISLYNKMLEQTKNYPEVEILCLIDNKSMTIGEKRQALLDSARGKWIAFMDDDDDITDDYMSTIINTIKEKPADVISFDQHCIVNGNQFLLMYPKVKSETHINKILHLYRYDDRTSESIQFMKK